MLQPHQRALRHVTTTGEVTSWAKTSTMPTFHLANCANRSAWCSSGPIRCRSRCTKTWCSACECTRRSGAIETSAASTTSSKRHSAKSASGTTSRTGSRPKPPRSRSSSSRNSASPACCRSSRRSSSWTNPVRRLTPRERAHRRTDGQPAGQVHDRHRDPQHGPGAPRERRVHLHADGPDRRARARRWTCFCGPSSPKPKCTFAGITDKGSNPCAEDGFSGRSFQLMFY